MESEEFVKIEDVIVLGGRFVLRTGYLYVASSLGAAPLTEWVELTILCS